MASHSGGRPVEGPQGALKGGSGAGLCIGWNAAPFTYFRPRLNAHYSPVTKMESESARLLLNALRGTVVREYARLCSEFELPAEYLSAFESCLRVSIWGFDAIQLCFRCLGTAHPDGTVVDRPAKFHDRYVLHAGAAHLGLCWQFRRVLLLPSMLQSTRSLSLHADHGRGLQVGGPCFIFPLLESHKTGAPAVAYATLTRDAGALPVEHPRRQEFFDRFAKQLLRVGQEIRHPLVGWPDVRRAAPAIEAPTTWAGLADSLVQQMPAHIAAVHSMAIRNDGTTSLSAPHVQEQFITARFCELIQRGGVFQRARRHIRQDVASFVEWDEKFAAHMPVSARLASGSDRSRGGYLDTHPALYLHDYYSHFLQIGLKQGGELESVLSINCGVVAPTARVLEGVHTVLGTYQPAFGKLGQILKVLRNGRIAGMVPICGEIAGHILRELLRALRPDTVNKVSRSWRDHVERIQKFLKTVATHQDAPVFSEVMDLLGDLADSDFLLALGRAVSVAEPVLISAWVRDGTGFQLAAKNNGADDWVRVAEPYTDFSDATPKMHGDFAYDNLTHRRDTYPLIRLLRRLQAQADLTHGNIITLSIRRMDDSVLNGGLGRGRSHPGKEEHFRGVTLGDAIHVFRPGAYGSPAYRSLSYVRSSEVPDSNHLAMDGLDCFLVWSDSEAPTAETVCSAVTAAVTGRARDDGGSARFVVAGFRRASQDFDLAGAHIYGRGRVHDHELATHRLHALARENATVTTRLEWIPAVPLLVRLSLVRKNSQLTSGFVRLAEFSVKTSKATDVPADVDALASSLLASLEGPDKEAALAATPRQRLSIVEPYVRILLELTRGQTEHRATRELGQVRTGSADLNAWGPQALVKFALIQPVHRAGAVRCVLVVLAATAGLDELADENEVPAPLRSGSPERAFMATVVEGAVARMDSAAERFPGLVDDWEEVRNVAEIAEFSAHPDLRAVLVQEGKLAVAVCTDDWDQRSTLLTPDRVKGRPERVVLVCRQRHTGRCRPHPGGWILAQPSDIADAVLLVSSSVISDGKYAFALGNNPAIIGPDWRDRCAAQLIRAPDLWRPQFKAIPPELSRLLVAACLCGVAAGRRRLGGQTSKRLKPSNELTEELQMTVVGTTWNTIRKNSVLKAFLADHRITGCPVFWEPLGDPFPEA